MVELLKRCKEQYKVACITNNVKAGRGPGMSNDDDKASKVSKVMALFNDVIESSVEGIRKPNPEIYKLACQRISVEPEKCLFIDDLGINLKPAKELGMKTIKVLSEAQALKDICLITNINL
jgi:putative hydrolase of the HAD superfamily